MLSIAKCRALLKGHDLTDEQIERVRDLLYQLSNLLIENYLSKKINATKQ